MKKACFFLICLALGGVSFAENLPNRSVFVEGKAVWPEQRAFFLDNFKMEATALGYTVVNDKCAAGYTFEFEVIPHIVMYDDGTEAPAPPDEAQFVLLVAFFRNEDNRELVYFEHLFTDLNEMYEFNQFVFFRAAVNIPPINEEDLMVQENQDWRNKWLYLRLSFDFPITFYQLKGDGLIAGRGAYEGSFDSATSTTPLDNRVIALPAGTVGLEFQFLNFMSIEPKFQIGWEYLNDTNLMMMAAGVELKFPLKFLNNVLLAPYGAFTYPILMPETSDIFDSFPQFGFGGGIQIAIKGGKAGAFFADVNYMYYYGDSVIYNNLGELAPNPEVIHFQRSVIGIGVGYKVGLGNRK